MQQQLEYLRAEPPDTATPPASVASEVQQTAREWKILADRLESDSTRIRTERGKLQGHVKELQAAYHQQTENLIWANGTINIFQEQIKHLRQTAQPVNPASQVFTAPRGSGPPTHQEMGGYVQRPLVSDPSTLMATTPEGHAMPPGLTPVRGNTPRPLGTDTPTLPRLTSQPSASLAVPPRPEPDREEDMDSVPQKGPESQQ